MAGRPGRGDRMITSLTAIAVALTLGLPIFMIGERIRARRELPQDLRTSHLPERTSREQIRIV